ncbi:MAG: hypothetical protein ACRYGK_05310 [Janthinobacterium lividum]
MLNKKSIPALLTMAALAWPALSHAAKFSDLVVVQEAAQTGMWTTSTSGVYPDGKPFPSNKKTACATKEEVLKSLDNPFMWNEKTGEEDRSCPTTLTTNTSALGVASMRCKPQTINVAGQSVSIPAVALTTEFKRVGNNNWTVKTGNIVTNITYHGAATASCVAKR